MDPQANTLDPKLRETYERVMATPTTPNAQAAQPPPPPPIPAEPQVAPEPVQPYTPPTPVGPAGEAFQPPVVTPMNVTPISTPLPSPASVTQEGQGTSPVLKILYIVGAIVFLLVYAVFWVKIFKLPVPFLG